MEQNNAGGFAWRVDDWQLLRRFLILGTEGGTYYVSERKLTKDACEATMRCIKQDGLRVVNELVEVSEKGRAAKNDYAIFVLAMCSAADDLETRRAALKSLPKVCRTGTHLFQFAAYVEQFRGWGRALRNAVAAWYNDMPADKLAYQAVKYQQRDGWSHRDMLRLSKPVPTEAIHCLIYRYITKRSLDGLETQADSYLPGPIRGYEMAQTTASKREVINAIRDYSLPRECVPNEYLKDADVWDALLENMPLTAMIRNLGNMSKVGLLTEGSFDAISVVTSSLSRDHIRKARVHPLAILVAMNTYAQGHGFRGSGTWNPVGDVIDALDSAFYDAFENVEPTGKRICIGLDISGSMSSGTINGLPGMTPRVGACAMSMVTYRAEAQVAVMAFCDTFVPLSMSRHRQLNDLVSYTGSLRMGRTDCALPITWALDNRKEFDAFIIYTDSETWYGSIHPKQALDRYRQQINPDARVVVVGMCANDFSIADPRDPGMMDVVGFDTSAPQMISEFIKGFV